MTVLTATNQKVQLYLTYSAEKPSTQLKKYRMDLLEQSLEQKGLDVSELFPNKQKVVLDYILYITAATGISKVGADRIAERCNVSVRTVKTVVKTLKSLDEFLVARLLNSTGGIGKYIFVDKKHTNFKAIMSEVFSLSDVEIALQFAQLNQAENVDISSLKDSKTSSNYIKNKTRKINLYNMSLSDINSLKNSIDQEETLLLEKQKERLLEYATNDYQIALFDFLSSLPHLANEISNNLYKLALLIGHEATARHFSIAKDILIDFNMRLLERSLIVSTSIRALFEQKYHEQLKKPIKASYDLTESFKSQKAILSNSKFYNWLEERE